MAWAACFRCNRDRKRGGELRTQRLRLAEAQAESWKQLQAGIAALFNGVKP
jgi:hypothetical protein